MAAGAKRASANKAAIRILASGLDRNPKLYPAVFNDRAEEIAIVVIEDDEKIRPVSRKEIQALDGIWTVDSPLIEHVEGLAQALDVSVPAEEVIERLTGGRSQTLPTPRLLGRSINPLARLEIGEVRVDRDNQRIDFYWEKETRRWMNLGAVVRQFGREVGSWRNYDEFADVYDEPYVSGRRRRLDLHWLTTSTNVRLECSNIDMIDWRGRTFILPSSPIAALYEVFGLDARFAHWAPLLLQFGEIPPDQALLLRQHLEAVSSSPEELLPKLRILPERTFSISYFQRNSSQF